MGKLELEGINGVTVLFVDDEEGVIKANVPMIKSYGFNVISADSGKKAIEIIKNQKINVLLIDYFMPDFNGEETIKEIREFNKEIVIVLQTAYAGQKPPIKMLQELDIEGYYNKTKDFDDLLILLLAATKTSFKIQEVKNLGTELDIAKEAVSKAREDNKLLKEQARLASIGHISSDLINKLCDELECGSGVLRMAFDEYYDMYKQDPDTKAYPLKDMFEYVGTELKILEHNNRELFESVRRMIRPSKIKDKFTINDVLVVVHNYLEETTYDIPFYKEVLANSNTKISGIDLNLSQVIIALINRGLSSYRYKNNRHQRNNKNYERIDFKIEKIDNNVLFTVRDYGVPLSDEEINDPSKQMINENGFYVSESGMGMYTAYAVISEQFRGKIWAEGHEEGGTSYYVSIPILIE